MNVMEDIKKTVDILDNIDTYNNGLSEELSIVDGKMQDLLHYVENNKINILWCYRYVREIKRLRLERRRIRNDMELLNKFSEHKNKLISKDNRQFLLAEMNKREKQLNQPYKNRQYGEEELEDVLKNKSQDS